MSTVIAVEKLSKKYIIDHLKQERYTSLRDVLADGAKRFADKLIHPAGGECAFVSHDTIKRHLVKGTYVSNCAIPANFLNEGSYFVGLAISSFSAGIEVHFL